MARKLRLESKGGVYHVLNRGIERLPLFRSEKTQATFLECLNYVCSKTGWRIHAWCLTENSYHLALETPEANLVEGMHWLQGTFSSRLNEQRKTTGRIFKDRYKSLVVDPATALGSLCHFIHLQPVATHKIECAALLTSPATSLPWLMTPGLRPTWYNPKAALNHASAFPDTSAGRKKYFGYLTALAKDQAAQAEQRFANMSKGWLIGTGKFAQKMLREHRAALGHGRKTAKKRQVSQESIWQETMEQLLRKLGRSTKALREEGKSVDWKLAVAATLKQRTTVTNRWLSTTLHMGNLYEVSRKVTNWTRSPDPVLIKKLA